jgi:hypothetical protein
MIKAALKAVEAALSRHAVQTATDAKDRARRQAKSRREQQQREEKHRQKEQEVSDKALARELEKALMGIPWPVAKKPAATPQPGIETSTRFFFEPYQIHHCLPCTYGQTITLLHVFCKRLISVVSHQ